MFVKILDCENLAMSRDITDDSSNRNDLSLKQNGLKIITDSEVLVCLACLDYWQALCPLTGHA